jgi:thioredoxin 1
MIFITEEKEIQLQNKCSLYFYSNWMPHNKKMLSILSKMEEENKDIQHMAIDIDQFKSVLKRFNISSIPTILLFKDGREKKRIVGIVLTSAMRSAYADI